MRSLRLTCCLMCLACILPGQAGQPPVAAQLNGLEDIVDVALGGTVIVVLKADGTVWEVYSSTPPAQVPELNGVVRIAAGICHSMALKEDGTVWEWPGPWNAPVPQPADFDSRPYLIQGMTDVMSIAAGETRSLGVKSDGTVWEWSTPRAGCSFVPVRQPMQVSGLEEVVKVAVAYEAWMHTLFDSRGVALKKDGTIWAWNSGEMETAPAPIEDLAGMVDVSASPAGDVALREDGTVWQWDASLKPGQVNGLEGIVAVASGAAGGNYAPMSGGYGVALSKDGTVWTWNGIYGRPSTDRPVSGVQAPVQVGELTDVVKIFAASIYLYSSGLTSASAAIRSDGTVWVW